MFLQTSSFRVKKLLLYVFEDNEAVIKMIIKGRSHTMRHVSRTHRVALDWLFDRINLDSKNPNLIRRHQKPTCWHPNQRKFHTWWVESFYSVLWYNGETILTRFRRRTSHSKISTNDESDCKGAVARIILDFSKSREVKLCKSRFLEYNCWRRGAIRATWYRHRPIESFWLLLPWTIHGKFLFNRPIQNWIFTVLGLLLSGKVILKCTSDRGDPMKHLGERKPFMMAPRNPLWIKVMPRDRPGRPDIDSQEEAWTQQFVIGNDEEELESSIESRSFVHRVNDQVRKRQKRISNVTENAKTFHDLVNANVCNNGISSIHGQELPEHLSIHCEHDRSHTQTHVRHIHEIAVWTRWDIWIGNNWLRKSFIEILVIDWW